ncbi:phage terminase small subunit P27 family [Bacteroides sp.]|uniref:phage terminase small subunit P27 family n=1 Tax=Bacteroides sp. TaxID=29523 RepID=UPI00261C7ACA|nr:phage terminase small subunit P27 family [Bacteroides sp.]MDD3039494.1 phage terminase small subunit P27 family [Bacteroides sp.]
MPRGKQKQSNEIKVLRGTDQPCRMTPQSDMTKLESLPKVRLKGTAKKIFEYTATELLHKKLLEVVGVDLLVAYAREMAIYHDLMLEVEKEGFTIEVETKNGTMTQINPKRKIAESALANAKSLASEFGFTPASRGKISSMVAPAVAADDFAQFEEIE